MTNGDRAIAAMQPAERRLVGLASIVAMLRMYGLFALLPLLAWHAGSLDGATGMLIGLAVGAYGLTQAALQMPLGLLSDRVGRVPVIVAGLLVFAAGSVVAGSADSIAGIIAGRLLQGGGAISATLTALLADGTREQVRTRAMAFFGIGIGGSFVIAIVTGPLLAAVVGVSGLFYAAALLALAAIVLVLLLPRPPRVATAAPAVAGLRNALRPVLLRLDLYVFLLHALLTANFVALPFHLSRSLQVATVDHWQVYVIALLLSLAVTVPLVISDDRAAGGGRDRIGPAVLLLLVGQLLLTFTGFSVAGTVVALVLFFGGFNYLEAGLPARLSRLADDDNRGAALGLYASAQFLGAFAGGVLGGRFIASGRPADVFFVCALLVLVWLAAHGLRGKDGDSARN